MVLIEGHFINNITWRKEVAMAENRDIRTYCKTIYDELEDVKQRLCLLSEGIEMEGSTGLIFRRHIDELINAIDWKLEIFSKVCPLPGFDETYASVIPTEEEFTPGYVGG